MRKMKIALQMMWMNGHGHGNYIGDHGVAEAWAKYLRRRDDVESVVVFGAANRPLPDCDVMINFHHQLPLHHKAKNVFYAQNAWSEARQPGGTVGVFNSVKAHYYGWLFPSETLRQKCGGVGAVIPFAADPERFFYQPDERFNHLVCFIGNDIRGPEVNEKHLIPAIPHGLVIYGGPYADPRLQAVHRGRLREEDLPKVYSSARTMLDIHIPEHLKNSVVNSRVYEILACGGVVMGDFMGHGLMSVFLTPYGDYREATGRYGSWSDRSRNFIITEHTWAHRVDDLMAYLKGIL